MDKLSKLRIFKRLAELGGFSAVARDLGYTQPVVSKAITALEAELKVRLVNRSSRIVALTDAGKCYYDRCNRILADLDDADASLAEMRSMATGTLRVTAPVPFGLMFISPRLARFKTMHPSLAVDLILQDEPLDLIKHDIDVAIRLGHLRTSGMIAKRLGYSPFICVASPEYLGIHGAPVSPENLIEHNCVVYSNQDRPLIWEFSGGAKKITVTSNYQCNNLLGVRDAVEAGVGIARLPLWMVDTQLRAGTLQAILADYATQPFDIHAVYQSGRKNPAKTAMFVSFIQQELQSVSYFLG